MRYEITIGIPVYSLNVVRGNHWSVKHKLTKRYENHIMVEKHNLRLPDVQPGQRAEIEIISYLKKKNFIKDYDNLIGGVKPLIDAMKRLKLISDDTMKMIGIPKVSQIECERNERTIIKVKYL